MRVYPLDADFPDPATIALAANLLRSGGLVAFPTETVYGLGANALDPDAVRRIFAAKGRPSFNPLIVHCAGLPEARSLAATWPEAAERLGRAFWPGPLTLVLPKRQDVPDIVTAGLPTVALRVPSHPVAQALLLAAGIPVAAPSANPSSRLSPTRAEHVIRALGDRVDVVLDAGETPVGIESTVVDLSGDEPVLLRPGSIDVPRLESVIGRELLAAGHSQSTGDAPRPSPGMLQRHYSPRARVVLLGGRGRREVAEIASAAKAAGRRVGALLLDAPAPPAVDHPVFMPADARGYARLLYDTLHRLDDLGCDVVLVEPVPDDPDWAGVRDRLTRAAAPE